MPKGKTGCGSGKGERWKQGCHDGVWRGNSACAKMDLPLLRSGLGDNFTSFTRGRSHSSMRHKPISIFAQCEMQEQKRMNDGREACARDYCPIGGTLQIHSSR